MIKALTLAIMVLVSPGGVTLPHFANAPLGAMHRAESYASTFVIAARKHGVDVTLPLALANWESGFDPKVRSRANAFGEMQLLPKFHRDIRGYCFRHPELCSVAVIDRGVQVLARHLRKCPSDEAAVRAYRLGYHVPRALANPEHVKRAAKVIRTRDWIRSRLGRAEVMGAM